MVRKSFGEKVKEKASGTTVQKSSKQRTQQRPRRARSQGALHLQVGSETKRRRYPQRGETSRQDKSNLRVSAWGLDFTPERDMMLEGLEQESGI